MSNFFNAIRMADMEKTHSAMIAWILDDKNDYTIQGQGTNSLFSTFPRETRSKLLCKIFDEPTKLFNSIETFTEWNDIDIIIQTRDSNEQKECWIIENKLKSQEHISKDGNELKWQTEKYENAKYPVNHTHNRHYLFLSLTGEQAKSSTGLWKSKTYKDVSDILSQYSTSEYAIIEEYKNAIKALTDNLKAFLDDYQKYTFVINKKAKKSEKTQEFLNNIKNPNERYIIENGLETIFQKCLLIEQIKKYNKYSNYSVGTSNGGTALLDIPLCDLTNDSNGQCYHSQIQFQNGSFKVLIHQVENGKKHRPQGDFLKEWEKVFEKVAERNSQWKINRPKSNSGRPYISISKKCDNWWDNIQELWADEFQECHKIFEELRDEFPVRLTPFALNG